MVEFLRRTEPTKYRTFLQGIKDGLSQEESLQQAYGVTLANLVAGYGRWIGVPGLGL